VWEAYYFGSGMGYACEFGSVKLLLILLTIIDVLLVTLNFQFVKLFIIVISEYLYCSV